MTEQRIEQMFEKSIHRNISGVIKVQQDDASQRLQELSEYIVTKEIGRRLSDIFTAYTKSIDENSDDIGVWVSGFFGSGKSHLLKIVSYVLDNRIVDGKPSVDYFKDKIPDSILIGDMQRASNVSHDIVLFNIDAKADIDKRSVATVFIKAFNEKCGYYGSVPWVAQMERSLDHRGKYIEFKDCFERISGTPWEEGRSDIFYNGDETAEALVACGSMSKVEANRWLDNAEKQYSMSIDDFAEMVRDYIDRKGNNHHVIFMVDEVGQYIGNNGDLMLHLQTITERLGDCCGGQAWVMVTSQQDIESTMKIEFSNRERIDFSKIQGRFKTRINLSGSNVDEVIKKRLLVKTETAKAALSMFYDSKDAVLRNLLTFTADTPTKSTYRNGNSFADIYPFVPYQINLLQSVFTGVRESGASGKHLAEGERSLLGAFHEVAMRYSDKAMGFLVPFASFYETIEGFLEHTVRIVIEHAKENESLNEFDIEILKLLFMLKYVKDLPANIENLTVLMIENVDEDKLSLKKKISKSLEALVGQSVVQKNGMLYTFLTNEEQDINKEISRKEVEIHELQDMISKSIFDDIYSETRFKVDDNGTYPFTRMIDGKDYGRRGGDMELEIITPYNTKDYFSDASVTAMISSRNLNRLIVLMKKNVNYDSEFRWAIKIDKYQKQILNTETDMQKIILAQKGQERAERIRRGIDGLREAISEAELWVAGHRVDVRSSNAEGRLQEGMAHLVNNVYTKRNYITKHFSTTRELEELCSKHIQLAAIDLTPNELALQEMMEFINRNDERNIPTTLKVLVDKYVSAPFGWQEIEIASIIIVLMHEEKLELTIDGERVTRPERSLAVQLTRRQERGRVRVRVRRQIDASTLQKTREVVRQLTNATPSNYGEEELLDSVRKLLAKMQEAAETLLRRYSTNTRYPGKGTVESIIKMSSQLLALRNPESLFDRIGEQGEALIAEYKLYKRAQKFFDNQVQYFNQALERVRIYDQERQYISDEKLRDLNNKILDIVDNDMPYGLIHDLPMLNEQFDKRHRELLVARILEIDSDVWDDWSAVKSHAYKLLDEAANVTKIEINEELRKAMEDSISDIAKDIDSSKKEWVDLLNGIKNQAMKEFQITLVRACEKFAKLTIELENADIMPKITSTLAASRENRIKYIKAFDLIAPLLTKSEERPKPVEIKETQFSSDLLLPPGSTLKSKEEVEKLLDRLRDELIKALEKNDTIRFI